MTGYWNADSDRDWQDQCGMYDEPEEEEDEPLANHPHRGRLGLARKQMEAAAAAAIVMERSTSPPGELGADDTMPAGPFLIGLTHTARGDFPPWTVVCGDGRAVAGHVPSAAIAGEIAMALNTVEQLVQLGDHVVLKVKR